MLKKLLYLLILIPFTGFGQTATFYVDTLATQNREGLTHGHLAEMEWKINGKYINYKSGSVEVAVNQGKPDTLFYKQRSDAAWDTILCTISEAKAYKFMYNHCCGGFDVADNKGKYIQGRVHFSVKGKPDPKIYLGTLGEVGIIVADDKSDVLTPECRSAMAPNIYQVTFSEIEICKDTTGCDQEIICLYEKEKTEFDYDFGYKTVSNKLSILFMPLSEESLYIVYDPQTNEILIR